MKIKKLALKKQKRGVKACIFGKPGIGKTTLLKTLPAENTLFVDLEAGDLAVQDWDCDMVDPKSWDECLSILEFCQDVEKSKKYENIFIDSITVASRLCFDWAKSQSIAKNGQIDTRNAYGLLGQSLMKWLVGFQHIADKNIFFVGVLDEKRDDEQKRYFEPQIEGSKIGRELPGIVDIVLTMEEIQGKEEKRRAFVCQTLNPHGFPAKDRSGTLGMYEIPPHLGKLIEKVKGQTS